MKTSTMMVIENIVIWIVMGLLIWYMKSYWPLFMIIGLNTTIRKENKEDHNV